MTLSDGVNILELLLLIWIFLKAQGWDAPHLKASLDSLYREFGFIKRRVGEIELRTNSHDVELESIRGRQAELHTIVLERAQK
jgi:hypothetical protein